MFFYCALLRPFSTCCALFSAINAKNIFNVILKTSIYCAPCALAPLRPFVIVVQIFLARFKKPKFIAPLAPLRPFCFQK